MLSQTEQQALRAVFRCARYRRPADAASLSLRVGGDAAALAGALRSLAARGLLVPRGGTFQLTLPGLAVAAALLPPARPAAAATRARPALRVVRAA